MEYKKIQNFKDLMAWQEGHRLVVAVYKITREFPREEIYSLVDQMKRAAVSVTSNIAEGFGRHSYKEKANFYRMAEGSLTELENQLLVSKDVGYLKSSDFNALQEQLDLTHRLLCGLISKTRSFINSNLKSPISNLPSPKSILYSLISVIILISTLYSPISTRAATVSKTPANTLTSGLVGYWTFDGPKMKNNVTDSSGQNNNGSLIGFGATSTAVVSGKLGQGLKFDGSNDYVNTGTSSLPLGNSPRSVFAWIYYTGPTSPAYLAIHAYGKTSAGQMSSLLIHGANYAVTFGGYSDDFISTISGLYIKPKRWEFVGYTYSGGTSVTVYHNAQSQTGALSGGVQLDTVLGATKPSTIGTQINRSGFYFPGSIDDVRIYNRALSAREIRQLYDSGAATKVAVSPKVIASTTAACSSGLSCGLVGYWTFDGPKMKNNVMDSSGRNNNGSLIGFGATSTAVVSGKLGQGLKFDGVGSYVNVVNPVALRDLASTTISAWVYPTTASGDKFIFDKGGRHRLKIVGTTGVISYTINYTTNQFVISSNAVPINKWTHIVATKTSSLLASDMHIYINGIEASYGTQTDGTGSRNSDSTLSAVLGEYYFTGSYFKGNMDDVRIYNRALSAKEIRQLYDLGAATKVAVSPKVIATPPAGGCSSGLSCGLVGYWTFDGPKMKNNATDSSGRNNNGSLIGFGATSTAVVSGKLGQALKFATSTRYVRIGDPASGIYDFTNSFSFSFWFKASNIANGATYQTILGKAFLINGVNGYGFFIVKSTKAIDFQVRNDATTATAVGNSIVENKWYHIVGIRNHGANLTQIYMNGAWIADKTDVSLTDYASTQSLNFGDDYENGNNAATVGGFTGSLDDVRVYNRVLSATEIRQLYNLGR